MHLSNTPPLVASIQYERWTTYIWTTLNNQYIIFYVKESLNFHVMINDYACFCQHNHWMHNIQHGQDNTSKRLKVVLIYCLKTCFLKYSTIEFHWNLILSFSWELVMLWLMTYFKFIHQPVSAKQSTIKKYDPLSVHIGLRFNIPVSCLRWPS